MQSHKTGSRKSLQCEQNLIPAEFAISLCKNQMCVYVNTVQSTVDSDNIDLNWSYFAV